MSGTPFIGEATRKTEQARLTLAHLPADAPLNLAFCLVCEVAAQTLEVERVGIWLFIDDQTALRCAALFERTKREFSSGITLHVANFPLYFAALRVRKSVPAEFASSDPRTAELVESYLKPLGISSMLDAGLFVDGQLLGVVCHEHVGASREWTTEERDFAGSVADLLALRIKAAEVNELKAAFRTQGERLIALQKTQTLELIAGGVAHDFANILIAVGGKAELLVRQTNLPDDARQQARDIVEAAERGHELMRELREFSQPGRPPTVVDLDAVTANFLPLLQGAIGHSHEVRYQRVAGLGRVLIDRTQYTRVLLNLALNARDAMPGGGPIDFRLAPVTRAGCGEAAAHFVLLEVADHGVGMDEPTRRRALEPFFTTKQNGTGLGLAVVQRIVDQVGGHFQIDSAPGAGTVVQVLFPRVGVGLGPEVGAVPASEE